MNIYYSVYRAVNTYTTTEYHAK